MTKTAAMYVGLQGEEIATTHLASLGYEIRRRNVRLGRDEIDLIAHDPVDDVLVFVEVKTRTKRSSVYTPEMSVDARKCEKLRRSARRWVAENDYDGGYRLDVIGIAAGKVVNHIKELAWE